MKKHEFHLKYTYEDTPRYRIALGYLVNLKEEKETEFPYLFLEGPIGSIGFMDIKIENMCVPTQISKGNRKGKYFLGDEYDYSSFESRRVLKILLSGVLTKYRRQGFAAKLHKRAEELALENKVYGIVAIGASNKPIRNLLMKLDYLFFDDGRVAIKKLNHPKT